VSSCHTCVATARRPGPEIQSAAAIAPVTVAGIALIRCGCSQAAWAIEIGTAIVFSVDCGERKIVLTGKKPDSDKTWKRPSNGCPA
jgi:hypothetical protein